MWRRLAAVAATVLFAAALPAQAENVLQDVSFSAAGDGGVNVTLQLAGPAGDAQIFTTESPPRIAVDLPDTRSEVANRRIAVGSGATSAISTIEAGGKTRVVIDLFQMATYDARTEGNRVLLRIGSAHAGSPAATQAGDQSDPAKRIGDGVSVSNIDFRRTPAGAGRVIITFDGEGAVADMQTEGGSIYIDLAHVGLPDNLAQRLDVTDFATPVQTIESRRNRGGTGIRVNTAGDMESLAYQTGNEYVIEVSPVAEEEVAAASNEGGTLGGDQVKAYNGEPVTFNFQDIPVRTVLQLIAEQSGKNIVAADTVQGNITLRLMNVPWDQTLDIILRAKQLDKREDGNVIWVAPQSEIASFEKALADARIELEQREALQTVYIPVNYGSAEEIANLLTSEAQQSQGGGASGGGAGGGAMQQRGFLSPRGSVTFDSRSNTLLLNDIPSKIAEIRELIEILDRPVDQVLIEARIVIATEDFSREMGARFGAAGIQYNSGNTVLTHGSLESTNQARNGLVELLHDPDADGPTFQVPSGYNVNLPALNPLASKFALGILGANYLLDLELSALETEGRGEVVANPRVITSNQQEAVIKQGDEVGYVTQQNSGGAGGQFTVQFKEVVLELKVTPTITQDDRVFLKMNVKKDQVEGYVQTALYSVPQISKREINTSVLVDNGQTVVLGGVYEFKNKEDVSKVPFLGDLPGIGKLFQNKLGEKSKAELLIFVTPKILRPAPKR
ncbi:MAG: type IV pilus secretin PilQ [Xanthomonadales bacterium]|nr:type IV pilus secretin PilQ [Xanthomonadales bacterium]